MVSVTVPTNTPVSNVYVVGANRVMPQYFVLLVVCPVQAVVLVFVTVWLYDPPKIPDFNAYSSVPGLPPTFRAQVWLPVVKSVALMSMR